MTSEERRSLAKFFKNSKEFDDADLHEEEDGSQGIRITDINMVMAKADKILEMGKPML